MSQVTDIMDELAAAIETAVVDSPLEIQVSGRMVSNPTPPTIDIYPGDPFRDPDTAGMGDIDGAYVFAIRARTGTADFDAGQEILLDMLSDDTDLSIAAAIYTEPTLNGLATSVYVGQPTGFGGFRDPGNNNSLIGVVWKVTVIAANS